MSFMPLSVSSAIQILLTFASDSFLLEISPQPKLNVGSYPLEFHILSLLISWLLKYSLFMVIKKDLILYTP